jgi:hypothetical protein
MTTRTSETSTTSFSISRWTLQTEKPHLKPASETKGELNGDVVLVQGRYFTGNGGRELVASLTPATVNRKLAIRQINMQLKGGTVKSDTFLRKS